jgi:ATP-dependent RNA helicase DHX40
MVEYAHRRLATQAGGSNDFATLLCIYQKCHQSDNPKKWCSEHFIHWRALKMAIKVQEQLSGILNRLRVRRSSKIKDSGSDKGKGSLSERVRQAICAGFFCNVARKSNTGLGFRSMDGHGSVLHIHPSSALFGLEDSLDWIVFHEVVWTTRIYARTVCPVRYEWLKELLPRLHVVDVHMLSSSGEVDRSIDEKPTVLTVSEQEQTAEDAEPTVNKLSRRNNESSVAAARMRYLERKSGGTVTHH